MAATASLRSRLVSRDRSRDVAVCHHDTGMVFGWLRELSELVAASELQQAPLRSQVIINRPWPKINDGIFDGAAHERQTNSLLDELVWWADVLRDGRADANGKRS